MSPIATVEELYIAASRLFAEHRTAQAADTLWVLADALEELEYLDLADAMRAVASEPEPWSSAGMPYGWYGVERRVLLHALSDLRREGGPLIRNPNSSGQGFSPLYLENPYYSILQRYGFVYSHTTPVKIGGGTVLHHTYVHETRPAIERVLSVHQRPLDGAFIWESTPSTASRRKTSGAGPSSLEQHLRRVLRGAQKTR